MAVKSMASSQHDDIVLKYFSYKHTKKEVQIICDDKAHMVTHAFTYVFVMLSILPSPFTEKGFKKTKIF